MKKLLLIALLFTGSCKKDKCYECKWMYKTNHGTVDVIAKQETYCNETDKNNHDGVQEHVYNSSGTMILATCHCNEIN